MVIHILYIMKQEKEVKISYWAAHLTTIVSVTLVLLIVGIIAFGSLAAGTESRRLREKIELSVVMADSIGNDQAKALGSEISKKPYALDVHVITKEEALRHWEKETGENLEETFGVNPLSPEISFRVAADYSSPEKISRITQELSAIRGVDGVSAPDTEMVEAMNRNLGKLTLILSIVGAVMLVISFVLINNTVHLTVYSKRFSIHTMQLVGATNGFICRPFVTQNAMTGLIAGLLAGAVIFLLVRFAPEAGLSELQRVVGWTQVGYICCGLIILGVLICGLAALLATTKYLRKDYDDLFS